ncbi:hypothetical protein DRN58_00840 [Thermococci archaeon]|nr:MAG: hypothetical protein DRN58_00840 [Thermococci archaeon]
MNENVKSVTKFRIENPLGTTTTVSSSTTTTATTVPKLSTTLITDLTITKTPPLGKPIKILNLKSRRNHFSLSEKPEFELWTMNVPNTFTLKSNPRVHLEGAHRKILNIKPIIERINDSLYKIKIPNKKSIKPGIYKLVVESDNEEEEIEFQWGLVSINTKKSIYKPNETSEILIVVLDKDGHLVPNAHVFLRVTDPEGVSKIYSTECGTIREISKGIYQAFYQTGTEGKYEMSVDALVENEQLSMDSYFDVKQHYKFDILREIPVVIDPRKGPTGSEIRIISYINTTKFNLTESLPPEFEIIEAEGAIIKEKQNEKILLWQNLTNNSVVKYSFKVPEKWPYLYEIGPSKIDYNSKRFIEARPWYLAVDPTTGGTTSGGLRPQSITCYDQGSVVTCDGSYPSSCPSAGGSDYLSCDDGNEEGHVTRRGDFAGVEGTYYNATITDCVEITKVEVCYEWSSTNNNPDSCEISIDNDGDNTWSAIVQTCPGTAGASGCVDVTNEEDGWSCSNFFGASGTRAAIRSRQTSAVAQPTTAYWDQLWYNVTYIAAGYLNSTLNEPPTTEINKTIYDIFTVNATVVCLGNPGDTCGVVNGTLRYNASSLEPDTQISTTVGAQPFFANLGNQTCGQLNATTGQNTCTLVWQVNATQIGKWKIDVLFTSELPNVNNNDTANAVINVLNPPNLAINLTSPTSDPNVSEGESFELNCTAECAGQDCENVNVFVIYCNGSLTCTPNEILNTTSSGLFANYNNISLGNISAGTQETATFNITAQVYGDYVIACNATSSNAGNVTSLPTNLSLHVNDFPIAAFTYPSDGDWLHGIENLNASSSSDIDGNIINYLFELDNNTDFSSASILCNSASENCTFDTTIQNQCEEENINCYLRLTVEDNIGATNSTIIQIGIDNTGPTTILDQPQNNTYITSESQIINASAIDIGSGVSCVEFFAFYDGSWHDLNIDCSEPYEYNWDLSSILDQTGIQVRARANDSEGNYGDYDIHGNITHDTTAPNAVLDKPTDTEIIQQALYLLNATSSSDATSGIKNAAWYYYNVTDGQWYLIGSDTTPEDGLTYSWEITIPDGIYNISVNVTDKAGLENNDIALNVVIDVQNQNPICTVEYPNGNEIVAGNITVNATVSDPDPGDQIQNVTFEYSPNSGGNWYLIGINTTPGLNYYEYVWDTTQNSDSNQYLIRCIANDNRGGSAQDESDNNFIVDNTPPTISSEQINDTSISVNEWICLNVTVEDNFNVSTVIAEIDIPEVASNENITLFDDGASCDLIAGDGVYSGEYQSTYSGTYNWTRAYATDIAGNTNTSFPGLTWNVTTAATMTVNMTEPSADLEINETSYNNKYNQTCNVSCNSGGADCENVFLYAQYNPGTWTDITQSTTDLVNDENNYSCGTLTAGTSCSHTFNITSGPDSGNNTWEIRCKATSSNAPESYSTAVNLTINDLPIANWTYPSEGEWLHGIENLNASSSIDTDGSIVNYLFELDNNTDFDTPSILCNTADANCTFDTTSQTQCNENDNNNCFLRLTVEDDDGAKNSSIRRIGIDNFGPISTLDRPLNNDNITTNTYIVNASVTDSGVGVISWVMFEYRTSPSASWQSACNDTDGIAPFNCTWNLIGLPDSNTYQLRVRANDSLGNLGDYDIHVNITVDRQGPQIALNSPDNNSYLSTNNVTFNFTAIDNLALTMNCSLYIDSILNQTNESTMNNTPTTFYIINIPEGQHNWFVNCSDEVGNYNVSETITFTIDLTNPSIVLESPVNGSTINSGTIINLTVTDDNLDTVWWSRDAGLTNNTLPSPYDIDTTGWSEGLTTVDVWANDSANNLKHLIYQFTIDNTSPQIILNSPINYLNTTNTTIVFNFTAIDNLATTLNCSLYIDSILNQTNESTMNNTSTTFTITNVEEGIHTWHINCSDNVPNFNVSETREFTVDFTPPTWSNQNQTINGQCTDVVHRGDTIKLSAYWTDNIELSRALLETNETGTWENKTSYESPQDLTGTSDWSNFTWSNSSITPGTKVGWRIYANDTTGNINQTNVMSFTVWGWSEISDSYLSPSGIKEGDSTTMNCKVQDNITKSPIEGYTVYFYNETSLLGTNTTDSDGYATFTFTVDEAGTYTITCNITDNAALYYNASASNHGEDVLGVGYGLSTYTYANTTYHRAYEGISADTTTPIDDPYTDLESDDNIYQEFRADAGYYAYTRFEMRIDEAINEITKINITWMGFGDVGSGTDGYILYVYNVTNQSWMQVASYSTDNTEQTESIAYNDSFDDIVNSSGYIKILARSYSPAPTTGATGSRWAEIDTDYIKVKVYSDILAPIVTLNYPPDYYSLAPPVTFNCSVSDDYKVLNVTLYGDWSGTWEANETNTSGINDISYTFTKDIEEGIFKWNCKACDKAGNCGFATHNRTLIVDSTFPIIQLQSPLSGSYTADTTINFTFIVTDNLADELNCSLYVDNNPQDINESTKNDTLTSLTATSLPLGEHFWNITCKDKALNQNWSQTWNFTIYEGRTVNITVINSSGITFENTRISIFDILGQEISSKIITTSDAILLDELALNKDYDIEVITPLPEGSLRARIKNLNITENLTIMPQVVENYTGEKPAENMTALYAMNDSNMVYTLVELYIPHREINVTNILHCTNWNFNTALCYQWEVNASEDYNMQKNLTHIWFNVSSFTAFGGGAGKPLPNVTEIRIYDVTNLGNTHSGGTLIGSGLNTTFYFYQREPKLYRVEIDVRNDAPTQWTIDPEDVVYHSGLNETWQIDATNDIWYYEGGINYTGGNWSNGTVYWNTSLGGKLTNGEIATFYYVFNMTTSQNEEYPVYFLCNDTSSNSGSYDNSIYNITRVGYLEVNLTIPPQIPGQGEAESNGGYKVGQNKIFIMNATVYCRDGYCGNVNGTLRYNLSSPLPDTSVNTTPGDKPFYVISGINPKNCSSNPMKSDEFCNATWNVNATGNLSSLWKLDVLFKSNLVENDTQDVIIEITKVLILHLSWTHTDFGICDPLTYGNSALLNDVDGYNISLDENSNDADGIYIKGTDLTPKDVQGFGSIQYGIGVSNITWNANENLYQSTNTTRLTKNYSPIRENVPAGSVITMYFWIDIPPGQYAQEYNGTLYVMANASA